MNWKPGDVAIIAYTQSGRCIGKTCTVVALHINTSIYMGHGTYQVWPLVVEVDIEGEKPSAPCKRFGIKPEWLRRPDEGYDGNDLVSWNNCAFKPKSLKLYFEPPRHINCRCSFKPIDIKKLGNLKWP